MPKFYTQYNRPLPKSTPAGSPETPEYGEVINDDGEIEIAQTGVIPTYQLTQECKPLDIYSILKQSGVPDPLSLEQFAAFDEAMIIDFTSAPRSLADAQMMVIKGQRAFDELPLVVRDEFGSAGRMIRSLEDGTFKARVSKFLPKKASDVPESEVKDESK